jgi:hypothetical protein
MTTPENRENDPPSAGLEREHTAAMEKARAEARAALTKAKAMENARLKAEKALAEVREEVEAVQTEIEKERQARLTAEQRLDEAQLAITAAQAEAEQAHQARLQAEQGKAEAEQALNETKKAMQVEVKPAELPSVELEQLAAEQRVSFVVRLTVDEQGQVRRTFVEHAHSGKKETFVDLDIQRLASFMKACIRPRIIPAAAVPPYLTTLLSQTPIPTPSMSATHLVVSDVQVFRQEAPGVLVLNIIPGESVTVQSLFQLRGPQASHLTDEGSPYEVLVYANEVTSGVSSLLTSYQANLTKGVLEYTAQMQAPGLTPGLYRLFTMVVLLTPQKMAGYYEGPIIRVAAMQPSANFATWMQESVSPRDLSQHFSQRQT